MTKAHRREIMRIIADLQAARIAANRYGEEFASVRDMTDVCRAEVTALLTADRAPAGWRVVQS
jgi:hypothetical protein